MCCEQGHPFVARDPRRHVGRLDKGSPHAAEDLRGFIGFLREFADRCHHDREEGILFPALVNAGIPEQDGPIGVMLAEYVEGRAFIRAMETAVSRAVDTRAFSEAATRYSTGSSSTRSCARC